MISRDELVQLREYAQNAHKGWKQRSLTSDLIVQGRWNTVWPDLTIEERDPLVENIYNEALYDKAASAAAVLPFVEVSPTRGTRLDRAEGNAQMRRRAFISFMRDSLVEDKQIAWTFDWLQHGAMYGMPWKDFRTDSLHPYAIRFDPRTAYPIAHDSKDELRQIFFLKYRKMADLERDYGLEHEALRAMRVWSMRNGRDLSRPVEEVWYADETHWGVAVVAAMNPTPPNFRYVNPLFRNEGGPPFVEWLVPLHEHGLNGCPVVEKAKRSPDGEYRGALDDMIPNLKVAHNVMARIITQLEISTALPTGIEGVENPEDFGPNALLYGDGSGNMDFKQPPMRPNFEALQQVALQLDSARNAGAYPQQRAGDPGASISSAKGTVALQGSFNAQLAWNQRDLAIFYRRLLGKLANFDQVYCGGANKQIEGWDEGEMFSDKYDPATFWKDDFRCEIGFARVGLDEQANLTRLAMASQMGGMSARSFMRKSGLVDNPLNEEREQALESVASGFMAFAMAQANAGNLDPIIKFVEKVDGDEVTARAAIIDTIKSMFAVPAQGGPAGQGGGPNAGAALQQARSLEAGGIPGNAAGQPSMGPELASLLPPGLGRAAASVAPGASGT